MEGLRARARRLLREIVSIIMPHLNLDDRINEFVDAIVAAAVDETVREIARILAMGK